MASAKKLPSGSWRVRLYIGKDADGKSQYKSFTADTKREAEFLAAQYNQLHIDVNRSEITLKQAITEYIESKENVLSPSTVRGYHVILDNYLPELMQTKIKDISALLIQQQFNNFAANYSAKTCRNAHGLISSVLKIHRPELILNTTLPQKKKRDIYVPDAAEIKKVHAMVKGRVLEIPFLLACKCGLRASEISALEVKHLFTDHIRIEQARVPKKDGGQVLKAPKSNAGYRDIPIDRSLYDILIAAALPDGRIVPQSGSVISNEWSEFKTDKKLDTDFNFHALRHHYASKCLLMGMPQKYIAELMGHSSVDMIEKVYQHTFPSAMEKYAQMLREDMKKDLYDTKYDTNKNKGA